MIGATVMNAPQPSGCSRRRQLPPHVPATAAAAPTAPGTSMPDNAGFYAGESSLSPSERAGREIWYKATAGNARFHTYVFPQRINVLIDWYRVLNARERGDRFAAWGIINDPGCCLPGSDGCPAKSLETPTGSTGAPATTSCCATSGAKGIATPPATTAMLRSTARTRTTDEGPAPVRLRSRVRHLDRRPRVPQVPQSAFRQGAVAQGQRQPRELGRLSWTLVERPALERQQAQPVWPTARSSRRS